MTDRVLQWGKACQHVRLALTLHPRVNRQSVTMTCPGDLWGTVNEALAAMVAKGEVFEEVLSSGITVYSLKGRSGIKVVEDA